MPPLAAVFEGPGQPLSLRSFQDPCPGEGQAAVEISCCTLCGSDLHSIRGDRSVPVPTILGHEMVGRISSLGGDLRDEAGVLLEVGDRVSWSLTASCGTCFYCRNSLPQKCESLFKYGHQQLSERHPLSGGLATHCLLAKGTSVVKIPTGLPDEVASPANCATATVAAAFRAAGPCGDQTVLIHGAGMLGLTAAAMARVRGARHVIVSDPREDRRRQAEQFGADPVTPADLPGLTEGRGADLVIDLSGAPEAVEEAVSQVRIGGRVILVGSVFPTRALSLQADELVRRLLRIEGVHNYTAADLVEAFAFLAEAHEQFPFRALVGVSYPLAGIDDAVESALLGEHFRVAVRPRKDG